MALVKCVECGKEVSDIKNECPNCGFPIGTLLSDESDETYLKAIQFILKVNKELDANINQYFESSMAHTKYTDEFKGLREKRIHSALETLSLYLYNVITIEKVEKASTEAKEDYKKIQAFLNTLVQTIDKFDRPMLYIIIKDNKLSDRIMNDNNIDLREYNWCEKYIDILEKIEEKHFQHYLDNKKINLNLDTTINYLNETLIPYCYNRIRGREMVYILAQAFEELHARINDNFGVIELCEYLDNKYKSENKFVNIIGYVEQQMSRIKNATIPDGSQVEYCPLPDGRKLDYTFYYYSNSDVEENEKRYKEYNRDYIIERLENNFAFELNKCFEYAEEEIIKSKNSRYDFKMMDYTLEDMNLAKEYRLNEEKKQEDRKAARELSNQFLSEMSRVQSSFNSNSSLKCPTCGSTSVEKISTLNRAFSVGLFGLSSSKVGKTMQCKNCGYKW